MLKFVTLVFPKSILNDIMYDDITESGLIETGFKKKKKNEENYEDKVQIILK